MKSLPTRLAVLAVGCAVALLPTAVAWADDAPLPDAVHFNRDVRPILSESCFACHGFDKAKRKADLRLDTRAGLLGKLEDGSAVVPGKPGESLLLARVTTHDPDEVMPPPKSKKPALTARQIAVLKKWVEQGAPWEDHWSYVPVARPGVPEVRDDRWVRNPIDAFVLARLEREKLAPTAEADRTALIRRVTLDLTGLPPTSREVDDFLADDAPGAYERVVDRLLSSVRYGERMALEWLDAARYADTHGYHIDSGRDMTRWREWVIEAFHKNKPYDAFTVEQLAGDLLPDATTDQRVASGFNRNHMVNFEGGAIAEEYRSAYVLDRVNTTGTVWLGLTVGCVQCHDHKFDPITQREYYGLYAFFNSVAEKGLDGNTGNAAPVMRLASPDQERRLAELSAAAADLEKRLAGPLPEADAAQAEWEASLPAATRPAAKPPANVTSALKVPSADRTEAQRSAVRDHYRRSVWPGGKAWVEQLAAAKREKDAVEKAVPTTMVMQELPKPRDTFVFVRGAYDKPGDKVTPGVPAFLPPLPADAPANRLTLARWLVDRRHPLTSRVTANRYWQMVFGTGLVKTVEDFGSQGEAPTHPELLDWLAAEFMESGWDVRHLLRLYVTSSTYRQSSVVTKDLLARDPENRLLARGTRHRLPAELIRDQALAASGLLDGRVGGASVSPYQPPGLWEELMSRGDGAKWSAQTYVQSTGPDLYRRTMYTFWKRTSPPPTLSTFDAPDRETCTVRRGRTNTPLQALVLMNDPTYVEAARKLAERALAEPPAGATDADRAAFAFRAVLTRRPTADESAVLVGVLAKQRAKFAADPAAAGKSLKLGESPRHERMDQVELAAWATVCGVILNLDEAVTRG